MNDEQFDKELSTLYQQRKSQIVAPNIALASLSNRRKYSAVKLLSIFTMGGIVSFGIMAIITHLAKKPEEQQQMFTSQHQVKILEDIEKVVDEKVIVIKPKLPPKPKTPVLSSDLELLVPVKQEVSTSSVEKVELNAVQIVKLPHFKEPVFLLKPIHKVMPKYSQKTSQEQESGAIRLRYEIDIKGRVNNIEVVSSDVSRELRRSAKKALAKWKYAPNDKIQGHYEIIFEFNPEK